jgi:hypothetical protein
MLKYYNNNMYICICIFILYIYVLYNGIHIYIYLNVYMCVCIYICEHFNGVNQATFLYTLCYMSKNSEKNSSFDVIEFFETFKKSLAHLAISEYDATLARKRKAVENCNDEQLVKKLKHVRAHTFTYYVCVTH